MKRCGENVSACARKRRAIVSDADRSSRRTAASDSAVGSSKKAPGLSLDHRFARAAASIGDGRPSRRPPPRAARGRNLLRPAQSRRSRCPRAALTAGVVDEAEQRRRARRARSRSCAIAGPSPATSNLTPASSRGVDRKIDPLVRQEARCDEEVIAAAAADREAIDVGGRMQHVGIALHSIRERALAPLRLFATNRVGRFAASRSQRTSRIHHRPRERGESPKPPTIPFVVEEKPADRVDEADVHGILADAHALGPGARRADDQIVLAQIECLERARIQRREIAKVAVRSRNACKQRRAHALARDRDRRPRRSS